MITLVDASVAGADVAVGSEPEPGITGSAEVKRDATWNAASPARRPAGNAPFPWMPPRAAGRMPRC
jgi:hypothetical protein